MLPLKAKSFYLDLTGYKGTTKLRDDIRKLGGTVEEFLSKEVKYLVTVKTDCNSSANFGYGSCESMSPSTFHSSRSGSFTVESPTGCGSSHDGQVKTRGQSLVEKSKNTPRTGGSCDIIQNAHRLGTKVLQLNYMLEWIAKTKALMKRKKASYWRKNPIALTKVMVAPYLKYESFSRIYRPMFKEFKLWPSISFTCKNNTKSPFNLGTPANSENQSECRKDGNEVKKFKLKKWNYCEICMVQFNNVDEHVKVKTHSDYSKNVENFKLLDHFIWKFINLTPFSGEFARLERDKVLYLKRKSASSDENAIAEEKSQASTPKTNMKLRLSPSRKNKSVDKSAISKSSVQICNPKQAAKLRSSPHRKVFCDLSNVINNLNCKFEKLM